MCLVPLTPCELVQPGSRPGTPRPRRRTEETVPEDDVAIDRIRLSGISATGYHGVLEQERREGQTFVADIVLHVDTRPAAEQDRLDLTVDYGVLAQEVVDVLIGSPADLLETVAERIAAVALEHEIVQAVDVVLHKPQAPIPVPFTDVTVEVHRDRVHPVSYTHLRAHETVLDLVCRLLLEK